MAFWNRQKDGNIQATALITQKADEPFRVRVRLVGGEVAEYLCDDFETEGSGVLWLDLPGANDIVFSARLYCTMKIQVLKEVSGENMQETIKAQIAELTAILAKLGGAGK